MKQVQVQKHDFSDGYEDKILFHMLEDALLLIRLQFWNRFVKVISYFSCFYSPTCRFRGRLDRAVSALVFEMSGLQILARGSAVLTEMSRDFSNPTQAKIASVISVLVHYPLSSCVSTL
jgi:hypothetical protein